jgi:hypothetical protein
MTTKQFYQKFGPYTKVALLIDKKTKRPELDEKNRYRRYYLGQMIGDKYYAAKSVRNHTFKIIEKDRLDIK